MRRAVTSQPCGLFPFDHDALFFPDELAFSLRDDLTFSLLDDLAFSLLDDLTFSLLDDLAFSLGEKVSGDGAFSSRRTTDEGSFPGAAGLPPLTKTRIRSRIPPTRLTRSRQRRSSAKPPHPSRSG